MSLADYDIGSRRNIWYAPFGLLNIIGLALPLLEANQLIQAGNVAEGIQLATIPIIFLILYFSFHAYLFFASRVDVGTSATRYINGAAAGDPGKMSISFFLGAVVWYVLLSTKRAGSIVEGSILSSVAGVIPESPLNVSMASIQGQVSEQAFLFANTISAPYVEEVFFAVGIMAVLLALGDQFGVPQPWNYIQATTLTSLGFATFHVASPVFAPLWVAAFAFATVIRFVVISDVFDNTVPGLAVFVPFAIGAHIVNNIVATGGFQNWVSVLSQDLRVFVVVVAVTGIYVYWALDELVRVFNNMM